MFEKIKEAIGNHFFKSEVERNIHLDEMTDLLRARNEALIANGYEGFDVEREIEAMRSAK